MSMGALGLQHDMDGLAAEDVRRLSDFIYQYSGIKMPPAKKTMLEGRLRKRLRAPGFETIDAYCTYIFDGDGLQSEAVHIIDVVTTNKTDFFREARHFDYLTAEALPMSCARQRKRVSEMRRARSRLHQASRHPS